MEKSYTQRISEFLADLRYEDLPPNVVEQAKKILLHVLGAAVSAIPIHHSETVIAMTQRKGGIPEATIWGSNGVKVPVDEAAFANATLADIMDWEDCGWTGHPSAGTVPVALALAEAGGRSGKDFLTAMVAGYEGYWRIAMAAQPTRDYITGGNAWGLVSWQIYAACIAAGKMMGFDADQMNQMMGAALYQAIVPCNKHSMGTAKSDIYHYAHGFCARNGIMAAVVTRDGFDNCRDALDGQNGFWKKVSDQVDWEWHVRELGSKWYITETCLKPWPANIWIETPLDLLNSLCRERPIAMEEVEKIRISPHPLFICADYESTTQTTMDAEFNIPYCLTAYLMDPTPSARWFGEEMLHNPELIAFTKRFEFFGEQRVPNDNFDEFKQGSFPEVTLEVHLRDGSVRSGTMRHCKGHPLNNFTMEEEREHFRLCCAPVLPSEKIEAILELADRLEELDDLSPLAELTAAASQD